MPPKVPRVRLVAAFPRLKALLGQCVEHKDRLGVFAPASSTMLFYLAPSNKMEAIVEINCNLQTIIITTPEGSFESIRFKASTFGRISVWHRVVI